MATLKKNLKSMGVCLLMLGTCFTAITACTNSVSAPVHEGWNDVETTQVRHRVQPGETVYSIAWRYNLSDTDLAQWNNLHKPYYLRVGQILRLTASASAPTQAKEPQSDTTEVVATTPAEAQKPAQTNTTTAASQPPVPAMNNHQAAATRDEASAQPGPASATVGTGHWSWPVKGPIRTPYGENGNKGIDIAVPTGTPVKAVQPGTVVYAGAHLHGYGQLIIVKQKDNIMTAYAHNSKLLVSEGSEVTTAGQTIALSGDSEASYPMVHFEVRKAGKPVDPMQYLN